VKEKNKDGEARHEGERLLYRVSRVISISVRGRDPINTKGTHSETKRRKTIPVYSLWEALGGRTQRRYNRKKVLGGKEGIPEEKINYRIVFIEGEFV